MQNRKKAQSSVEKKAIHILLDCSNTIRVNRQQSPKKQEENLCPWIGKNPHLGLENKNIRLYKKSMFFAQVCSNHRYTRLKKPSTHTQTPTPKSTKHKSIFENTVCIHKKIINLSEEFQEIYNRRKESFFRQKHHNRLKTVA